MKASKQRSGQGQRKSQQTPDALTQYALQNLPTLRLIASLLPYQQDAILDDSSHKAILATRRAGKSHACCVALIVAALARPDAICHYLALTRASAKKIAWSTLKKLCRKNRLGAKFSESELTVNFPNGSYISLTGVNQENLLDNLRGTPIDLAVLDEAGSYRGGIVEQLIEEVLEPAFADYNGKLIIIGTPTPVLSGYFYKATTGQMQEFKTFKWDLRDNPHIANGDPSGWLERHRKKKGWSLDNPKFLREYCGVWKQGDDWQVYRFSPEKNSSPIPDHALTHKVLGVDLGFKDETAFIVLGFNPSISRKMYVLYSRSASEMQLSDVARTIKNLQETYQPMATVVDEGGLGKSIAEDWRTRLSIPCEPAKKTEKRAYIEELNSDLHEGLVQIPKDHKKLQDELLNLAWDDEGKTKENPSLPNHLADAFLYAWRKSYPLTRNEPERKKILNAEEQIQKVFENMDRQAAMQDSLEWWERA